MTGAGSGCESWACRAGPSTVVSRARRGAPRDPGLPDLHLPGLVAPGTRPALRGTSGSSPGPSPRLPQGTRQFWPPSRPPGTRERRCSCGRCSRPQVPASHSHQGDFRQGALEVPEHAFLLCHLRSVQSLPQQGALGVKGRFQIRPEDFRTAPKELRALRGNQVPASLQGGHREQWRVLPGRGTRPRGAHGGVLQVPASPLPAACLMSESHTVVSCAVRRPQRKNTRSISPHHPGGLPSRAHPPLLPL